MLNTNSSISSQAVSANSSNSTSTTTTHCNKNLKWRKSSFWWILDKFSQKGYGHSASPAFSFDDLKCNLEFSTYINCPQPSASSSGISSCRMTTLSGPAGTLNCECYLSVFLYLNCDDVLKKYNAVSGEVQISAMKCGSTIIKVMTKNFEIQASTYIDFPKFLNRITATRHASLSQDELTFHCEVTYAKIGNKLSKILDSPLFRDLERLLNDKHFSDVVITVKGKNYSVYKGILAARSPVFDAMFRNNMQENKTNVVNISDISQEVFEEILLYIYCGKIKNLEKLAYELLPAADKYDLKELVKMCEETLAEQLSKDNAIKILILAHTHHAVWLKMETLEFIKLNTRSADVKNSEIWNVLTSFHPDLMAEMLTVLLDK